MISVEEAPEVVETYLQKEREAGGLVGPLTTAVVEEGEQFMAIHINRLRIIAKPHQPGKWLLIVDLPHPVGHSVNDGIQSKLVYASVDQAASTIVQLGRSAVMVKLNVASAYRIVPVHPDDRLLQGMRWKGGVYIDKALPFGLSSAPKIFTALSDAVQ